MRICYLGDANVQVRRVAEYFVARGDEVHLVTARPAPIRGVQVHSFAQGVARGKAAFLLGVPAARRLVGRVNPEILHVFYATSYGLVSSLIPGPPVVLSPMGTDVLISARGFAMSRLVRRALSRTSVILSVAPHMTRALVAMGADPGGIQTFPRGVDLERFPIVSRRRAAGQAVVLSNRRLEPVYNVEQLLLAAPLVLERFPSVKFEIYGEGGLKPKLEALAASRGVSGSVRFAGIVDHDRIAEVLAGADIYVSCSRSDGASVSLLEAMASGLYPVVSRIEANLPWITDGDNGALVELDDPRALAEALGAAIGSNDGWERTAAINRRIIEERASWSSNMPRIAAIYEDLARRR